MKKKARVLLLPTFGVLSFAFVLGATACTSIGGNGGDNTDPPTPETKTYTITYVTDNSTTIPAFTAKAGDTVTAPADPAKDGYRFSGWYLTADMSGEAVNIVTVMPENDITYYAGFIKLYTVSFDTDGGTAVTSITDIAGAALTRPENPVKDGYVFDGWYLTADKTGNAVEISATMPESDTTYYAKYLRKYSLVYSANAPDGVTVSGNVQPTSGVEGSLANVAAGGFAADGYRFIGWSTDANGSVNVGSTVELNGDITLYAVWNKGYRNKNNDDYLFVDGTEAVLVSGGKESVGTYNAQTKTFTVITDGGSVTGRLFEDNTYSCYGEQLLGEYALYNAYSGDAETSDAPLKLFDNGIAEYDGASATYEYIGDGNFALTSGETSFVFALDTKTIGTDEAAAPINVYYKRGDECGEYTLYGGRSIYTLDGYGNAGYDQYGNGNSTACAYTLTSDGVAVNGKTIALSGDFYAEYSASAEGTFTVNGKTLVLDGYLNAKYDGADGYYAIKTVSGVDGTFVTVAVADKTACYKLDGETASEVGEEIGEYDRYENGSLDVGGYNFKYTLDGAGKITITRKSRWSSSWSTVAEGTYTVANGEYTVTSDTAEYNGVKFILAPHSTNGSIIVLCYNTTYGGTYNNGEDTLVLDGYGNSAVYTKANATPIVGAYTYSSTTITSNGVNYVVDTTAKTFTVEAAEKGTYNSNDNKGTSSNLKNGDIRITLDGAGGVKAEVVKEEWDNNEYEYIYKWASLTTGTYTQIANGAWQFTSADESKLASFKFMLSGSYFSKEDASKAKAYANGDQSLDIDGFGNVVYTDGNGASHTGSYSVADDHATLTTDDGKYTFKLDNDKNTFIVVGNEIGVYTLVGGEASIEFDGEGNAVIDIDGEVKNGNYSALEGSDDEYVITADTLEFTIRINNGKYTVAYENASKYVAATDYSTLTLGKYGSVEFVEQTGRVRDGEYVMLSEHIARVHLSGDPTSAYAYYRMNFDNGTFVRDNSEFIAENNVLVAYNGSATELVIADGITAIGDGVFEKNQTIVSVDLNDVTIIGANAFANCPSLVSVVGDNIERIGDSAFKSSTLLAEAEFGEKVEVIGDNAFFGVSSTLKSHALVVVIKGGSLPELGSAVFSSNDYDSTFCVDSLEVALSWFADENTAAYANYITFGSAEQQETKYYCLSDWQSNAALTLCGGRAARGSYDRWLYVVGNGAITFYTYDASVENCYTSQEVAVTDGIFGLGGKYFAAAGTAVTYTDANDNVLVVTVGAELSATYNGTAVTLEYSRSAWTFDATAADGYDYTFTVASTYEATSTSNGTFTATSAFKAITYNLNGVDGQSTLKIKQTSPTAVELSSSAYLYVNGTRKTIYTGRYSAIRKDGDNFVLIDLDDKKSVYYITLSDDDKFSFTVDTYTATTYDNGKENGVTLYTNTNGDIVYAVLRLKSYSTSTSLTDYKALVYTIDDDGNMLFENISEPSWIKGKSYTVSIIRDASGEITGATVEEKAA